MTQPTEPHPYDEDQVMARRDLARTIAQQAAALAEDLVKGPEYAAVARLVANVDTLRAWTPDDRSH